MERCSDSWDSEQLHAITRWYGASNFDPSLPGDESIVLAVDPTSTHGQTLRSLQDLFDSNIEVKQAAEDVASRVIESQDVTGSWSRMLHSVCSASMFQDRAKLFRLADMMFELARMPYMLPRHPYASSDGSSHNFADGLSFTELPGFGFTIREAFQTPTQYISLLEDVTLEARNAARERWCNISSFVAIISHHACNGALPRSLNFAYLGLDHIAVALESKMGADDFDPSVILYREIGLKGMPSLWVPAAAMWIILAGRELLKISAGSTRKHGALWAEYRRNMSPKPPDAEYTAERWLFWRQRLVDIANSDMFTPQVTAACDEAASQIATMMQETAES